MIEYQGKIAGVIMRGGHLRYVLARGSNGDFRVQRHGDLHLSNLTAEAQTLRGAKIICGINHTQYCSKNLKTISGAITGDPDSLLWELEHACTEGIDQYYFSFMNLLSSSNSLDNTAALGVKKQTFERLGTLFEENDLVLHKLVFEPEAVRQSVKDVVKAPRTMILIAERDHVHLQLHARRRLLLAQTLSPINVDSKPGLQKLAEEIGTLLLTSPAAKSVSRRLELLIAGEPIKWEIALALKENLPFEIEPRELAPADFRLDKANSLATDFSRYYLPFALAFLYNWELQCESSPAKNEAWS